MKILHHPRVARALGDPRAMDVFVAVVRYKERLAEALRDLRTVVRDLEKRR
jgi:hypothetical protein